MSRVFVMGDCHRSFDNLSYFQAMYGNNLTKEDYLIITGDFGFVFLLNEQESYWLDVIEDMPWTTLFINGNHDNIVALNQLPEEEWNGGKIHRVRPSVIHLITGEVFNIAGKSFFCFGGARSVDAVYRTLYKDWWPEEIPNAEEYQRALSNLEEIDYHPNYIISHAMPDTYVRELYGHKYTGGDKAAYMLNDFLLLCVFDKWYCGHYHIDAAMRPDMQICYKRIYEVDV